MVGIIFGCLSVLGAIISYISAINAKKYSKICDEITIVQEVEEYIKSNKQLEVLKSFSVKDIKENIHYNVSNEIVKKAVFHLYQNNFISSNNEIIEFKDIKDNTSFCILDEDEKYKKDLWNWVHKQVNK